MTANPQLRFFIGCVVLVSLLIITPPARAGGPLYVAGISYFNSGLAGTPLIWAQGAISYYTDQGNLSGILPGPAADAFVADAFSQWTSIPTAAVVATRAGQLAEDVNGSNVYVSGNGTIVMPADIMPDAVGTPVGVVYDADGTVTDALLGQGAGDTDECFSNAAYGGDDNLGPDANFLHALVVINGNCATTSAQLPDVEYRLVRVLGQVLGVGWSQVNDNILTGNPPPTLDDYIGFPVMHSTDPTGCVPISLCYSDGGLVNPYQPKMDDQASLSRLYPASTFSQNTVRIYGSVYFTSTSGQTAQGMQGVNVVARWIDPSTGLPSRAYAASSVSGFLFCGNAGNWVTGFKNNAGQPFNQYGSNDLNQEGFFDFAGLQLPNGATSGQYQLTIEPIDPLWSETVGPYEPSQVLPSGTIPPINVTVNLGSDIEQDILMQSSAVQTPDWFEPTSYGAPAAVPVGGDWGASLSPYGNLDYFWFSGQANRTLSVIVTALDESGAASEGKAQPVIGMWGLGNQQSSPAPANTPSAFNTSFPGTTMLNAQLTQTASFAIGISDIRGDGRPDYRYHARVFYGDHVNPPRASVAGGTAIAIAGLGLESNNRVAFGNVNAPPLAVNASEVLVNAPANADGLQNISLSDSATGASALMGGALTYGAGPNDGIRLIAGANEGTPVGGQAANPIRVQAVAPNGATPVQGASVVFTSNPPVAFTACSGNTSCTVLTDQSGLASTLMTVISASVMIITAQLAPASYAVPQQVQTTLLGTETALDLSLDSPYAWIAQGVAANLTLTVRVLSNGAPVPGRTVNFYLNKGSANFSSPSATTNSNGYASSILEISAMNGDVQASVCVEPGDAPCRTFYGTAVPASALQLQPVAGGIQIVTVGQSFQPVVVRVTDSSLPPDPVIGASVLFQSVVERSSSNAPIVSGGDNSNGRNPDPIILAQSNNFVISDVNGLASFPPSSAGFQGSLVILGTATAGSGSAQFAVQSLPPMAQ